MKTPTETYKTFDVVVVPFPLTDRTASKRRPALILSSHKAFNSLTGHSVLAMITSLKNAPWPLDITLENLESAGLSAPSVVRMKLFTLDHRLILRKAGELAVKDRVEIGKSLQKLFAESLGR